MNHSPRIAICKSLHLKDWTLSSPGMSTSQDALTDAFRLWYSDQKYTCCEGGTNTMAQHMVYCVKLQREAPGIDEDDIQGLVALEMVESIGGPELRQRVYENVSMEAWELWKGFLTMLMNEYRLNTMDPEVDPFILQQMEDFFFGEGAALPPGYVPPMG